MVMSSKNTNAKEGLREEGWEEGKEKTKFHSNLHIVQPEGEKSQPP
jgi:hypothetical protein